MRIVGISTSGDTGSVALREGGRHLAAREFPSGILHGQALLPALQGLLADAGWPRSGFSAVAVDVGPGSYTGCRIGLMAAKILAREAGVPLAGVPSLAAVAFSAANPAASGRPMTVASVLDARRGRVYAALYQVGQVGQVGDREAVPLISPAVADARAWMDAVRTRADLWAGSALAAFPELFAGVARAPEAAWKPGAGAVAALAETRIARGERDDPYLLEPLYLARTEAEEKFGPPEGAKAP